MAEIGSKEQRSFVRASLSFKVKFRVITEGEYEAIMESGEHRNRKGGSTKKMKTKELQ